MLFLRSLPAFARALLFVGLALSAIPIACVGFFAIPDIAVQDGALMTRADLASWELLPDAPVRLVGISEAGFAEVYGEDDSGQIWRCTLASRFDRACWISNSNSTPETQTCPTEDQLASPEAIVASKFPMDAVVDWGQATYCDFGLGGDTAISQYVYVLTDSGTVWQWGFDRAGIVNRPIYRSIKFGIGTASALAIMGAMGMALLALYRAGRGPSRQSSIHGRAAG